MRELLWRALAHVLATRPVADWLIRSARKRPYLHLDGYMHRWHLVPPAWHLPFTVRVHHILRPDADPYLHDHPWDWRTVVLRGWYLEEDILGQREYRLAGDTRAARAETFHRIDRVSAGGVWTLFIMGPKRHEWGFLVGEPPRKVHWREYVSPNGRGELVEDHSEGRR